MRNRACHHNYTSHVQLAMLCYNPHRYDPNYETSITAKSELHG